MSRRRLRFPLRLKWSLAIFVVAIVPLGVLGERTMRIQREGLADAERSLQIAVIDRTRAEFEASLDDAVEATHRVAEVLTDGRIADDDVRLELAADAMARSRDLAEVAIYAPDGGFVDAIRRGTSADTTRPERVADELLRRADADGRWLPLERTSGRTWLRVAQVMRRDGVVRGWLIGSVDAATLSPRIEAIALTHFGGVDRAVIADAIGQRAIAGHDAGRSLTATGLLRSVVASDALWRGDIGLTTEYRDPGGAAMVGTMRTLAIPGVAVVVQRPEAEAYRALGAARRSFLEAALVIAFCAVVAGLLLATLTTRPVQALVELTKAYGRREFARRSAVKTRDELEVLGDALGTMAAAIDAGEREIARRASVESNLARFLPAAIAARIAAGAAALALGGERRNVSVLFADVVSFTPFAETAKPETVVEFLNELFTVLTEVVFRHDGTIDKFMGDSVMALWGAPNDQPDHAARAIAAAEDMHRFVEASADEWKSRFGFDVRLAIGIASGEAVVGNLGSDSRMEYTAIGDVVNTAARLETLARPGQTLATAEAARAAGAKFAFASLGEHPLRGKTSRVGVMELL